MAYLSEEKMQTMGFRHLGRDVKISEHARIYNCEEISLGDHVRLDDFCVTSGRVTVGRCVHITPMCLIAGGAPGCRIGEFSTLAYGVKVFSQSDDYSGMSMCNSLIPKDYKNEIFEETIIARQVIIGANSVVMPGANIAEGCAVGACSLVLEPTDPWGIYVGTPARRLRPRAREVLALEKKFVGEMHDSI